MRNIGLKISYDGTRYAGWQIQKNAETVQGVIQDALSRILKGEGKLKASGRTDTGVHAVGQIAAFETDSRMTEGQFMMALNSLLPSDIRILDVFEVPVDFHPRYSAKKRWYRYIISNTSVLPPFFRNYSLWVNRDINIPLMNEYCKKIIGTHDFTSFATMTDDDQPLRRVFKCCFKKRNDFIIFDIAAGSFLRKMVRTIVGSFLEFEKIGRMPENVSEILTAKNRSRAGKTAQSCGLYLMKVFY
jgi:tRNA pseudouridine38-40 synthase